MTPNDIVSALRDAARQLPQSCENHDRWQERLDELEKAIAPKNESADVLLARIDELKSEKDTLQKMNDNQSANIERVRERLSEAVAKNERLDAERKAAVHETIVVRKERDEVLDKFRSISGELMQMRTERDAARKERDYVREGLNNLRQAYETLECNRKQAEQDAAACRSEMEAARKEREAISKQLTECQAFIRKQEQELADAIKERDALRKDFTRVVRERDNADQALADAIKELAQTQHAMDEQAQSPSVEHCLTIIQSSIDQSTENFYHRDRHGLYRRLGLDLSAAEMAELIEKARKP